MAPLKAVLFDFDGTLVDTTNLIYQSMRHATGEILGRDLSRETLMQNVGQPLPRQMELLDPDRAADLLESYRTFNDANHERYIASFPEVEAALGRLRNTGLGVAVVTSKRRHSVELALDSFPALRGLVDHFVTMEDTTEHKPRPEPLLKGLELLGGIPPESAAYVGDAPFDVMAARGANVLAVAVSWGAFTAESLRVTEPDHLSENLNGAVDWLLSRV